MVTDVRGWGACVAAALAAWWLVGRVLAYARRRGMLDLPGQRRSHRVPTPRGGGLGVVVVVLCGGAAALAGSWPWWLVASWVAALVLTAGSGWLDDHRDLPVLPRLLAQLLAAGGFSAAVIAATGLSAWWWPVGLLAGTWSINLHNFMDGIDGLLTQQVLFVCVVLAVLAGAAGLPGTALAAALTAAACVGFWPYNRSPARIFMGDVGSGALGLLVFMFGALVSAHVARAAWVVLAVCSGFIIDAGLTLAWRMCRGRRWYTPHREHLYQWLVRCGWTHTRTGCLYMLWNVLTLPIAWIVWHTPMLAPATIAALYLLGAALWWRGRRACLREAARRPA